MVLPVQVPSLVIPLEEGSLLVPNACVAEIISFTDVSPVEDAADWQVANVKWRELMLPCISYEKMCGNKRTIDAKDRIAIFNTITEKFEKRFYGLVVKGIPRLVRVTEQDLVEEDVELSPFEKLRVQISGESSIIPNLEQIEAVLASVEIL